MHVPCTYLKRQGNTILRAGLQLEQQWSYHFNLLPLPHTLAAEAAFAQFTPPVLVPRLLHQEEEVATAVPDLEQRRSMVCYCKAHARDARV